MIQIRQADEADFPVIRQIAYDTWPDTYGAILSEAQLRFMLDSFYSESALRQNKEKGHQFLLVEEEGNALGFASYEHAYLGENVTRLHKLYMLPESQGKGAGKLLIATVEEKARENNSEKIALNVNRFNKAQHFYLKNGYVIAGEEDIEIGHGYLMQDYKMEKNL
jgi:GNAT superfamily N-acetyltransferase